MERGDILIIHGIDYKSMAERILERAGVATDIDDTNRKVVLKPNLVTAKVSSSGATAHNELPAGVIEYLQEHGSRNTTIIEGSWVGDHAENVFRAARYHQVYSRYGVSFTDLQRDTRKGYGVGGIKIKLYGKAATVDYIINMPVLKGHCQITVTCTLKNSKGVIPNSGERRPHTLGLHRPTTHLNIIARSDLTLVDNICGGLDFEGGGNPMVMNYALGFKDPVLCGAFVRDCMGYSVGDMPYITMARNLGVGNTDTVHANMIHLSGTIETHSKLHMTRHVQYLAAYTAPEDACSTCYGSLVYALDRLNDTGYLREGLPPVCIGQGCEGQGDAIDVGQYTFCFVKVLGSCPPKAADIVEFLGNQWQ